MDEYVDFVGLIDTTPYNGPSDSSSTYKKILPSMIERFLKIVAYEGDICAENLIESLNMNSGKMCQSSLMKWKIWDLIF